VLLVFVMGVYPDPFLNITSAISKEIQTIVFTKAGLSPQ
jgi:hypothetical protein